MQGFLQRVIRQREAEQCLALADLLWSRCIVCGARTVAQDMICNKHLASKKKAKRERAALLRRGKNGFQAS